MDEKCRILNGLIEPFGYSYVLSQDIFTSRIDAWQRGFGYCQFYDKAASHFNMIFDCLPVYFNYRGRTWMIELWKGQYGINTGCEIGVYCADRILEENELAHELFRCADNENMLKMHFELYHNGQNPIHMCEIHWWLTAFSMGCFSRPSDLTMKVSVSFHNEEMADAFVRGLIKTGYDPKNIRVCYSTVSFTFAGSLPVCGICRRLRLKTAQCMNRFFCRVYLFVTRPFCLSIDRILYLYYYLPFAFRKILCIRKYKKIKGKRG